jgi:hypothetical protein
LGETGAERLDFPDPVDSGERLGHLAPVRVLDAREYDPFHELISFEWNFRGTGLGKRAIFGRVMGANSRVGRRWHGRIARRPLARRAFFCAEFVVVV